MPFLPFDSLRIGHRPAALAAAVLFTQATETLLLQRKYDLFTGGFLQTHAYLTWPERMAFLTLGLWMDFALFAGLGLVWFALARRLDARPAVAAYNFAFLTCVGMGAWLAAKFKALAYFNDTLNFTVIRNLGGGSLAEALAYVADEAAIIGVFGLVAGGGYWLGLRRIRRGTSLASPTRQRRLHPGLPLLILLITVALAKHTEADFGLRYGLGKKTSYALISGAFDRLTDLDGDGFGVLAFPNDLAPLDAGIYPGALDIPGNDIDEDGFGGDFIWPGPAPDSLAQLPPRPGDHILLIVLESARGDLVGMRWEDRTVAPNMTALAAGGSSLKYAYSHTGYTTSSIKALFNRTLSREKDRLQLVEFLGRAGYRLSFLSGQDESFGEVATAVGMEGPGHYLFDARSALDDRVYPSTAPGSLRLSEERMVRQFTERTGEVDWREPQFFYVNLQAAHFPYSHPTMPVLIGDRPIPRAEISAENHAWLAATYWNAIAVADQAVGALLERLKALGVYEKTTVMILGDHGESLFDDGFLGHGHALNETQTRIPLIINRPAVEIGLALGQTDMAELLIRTATRQSDRTEAAEQDRPVVQFVGSLHKPQLVGIVTSGDARTVLDLRTRQVFFSDLGKRLDFDQAWSDPELSGRTRMLIDTWGRARWEDHLTKSTAADQDAPHRE